MLSVMVWNAFFQVILWKRTIYLIPLSHKRVNVKLIHRHWFRITKRRWRLCYKILNHLEVLSDGGLLCGRQNEWYCTVVVVCTVTLNNKSISIRRCKHLRWKCISFQRKHSTHIPRSIWKKYKNVHSDCKRSCAPPREFLNHLLGNKWTRSQPWLSPLSKLTSQISQIILWQPIECFRLIWALIYRLGCRKKYY